MTTNVSTIPAVRLPEKWIPKPDNTSVHAASSRPAIAGNPTPGQTSSPNPNNRTPSIFNEVSTSRPAASLFDGFSLPANSLATTPQTKSSGLFGQGNTTAPQIKPAGVTGGFGGLFPGFPGTNTTAPQTNPAEATVGLFGKPQTTVTQTNPAFGSSVSNLSSSVSQTSKPGTGGSLFRGGL